MTKTDSQSIRSQVAWLHRRCGVGLAPGELDAATARGTQAEADRLLNPDANGVPADPDPWAGSKYSTDPREKGGGSNRRAEVLDAAGRWIDSMVHANRPLAARLGWFWHGHFATSVQKVHATGLMIGQFRTQRAGAFGTFPDLLRTMTVDPAMLIWLDGRKSTGRNPNENYGREMMELFSLGLGNYAESDVQADAKALTGWSVTPAGEAAFLARRHDDSPQTYLGRPGVHDVDTVISAVAANPAMATFIAGKIVGAFLGPDADPAAATTAAQAFTASGFDLNALYQSVVTQGIAGTSKWPPVVVDPVTWWVQARRATGANVPPQEWTALLVEAGQFPMVPPNVGGWPGGNAWLSTSTTAARYELAGHLAEATDPSAPPRAAAAAGDWARLADTLGRPEGFGPATVSALVASTSAGGAPGVAPLTIALASPELTLA